MKAIFEINGKTIYAESDPSITSDTMVKVRSLDSFAQLLHGLETPASVPDKAEPIFVAKDKSGKRVVVVPRKRSRKGEHKRAIEKRAAAQELAKSKGIHVAPEPQGGFRTPTGSKIILGNYGVSREEVAIAINEKSKDLTNQQLQLLALRFGIGDIKRPHTTEELHKILYPNSNTVLSGQAQASKDIFIALKRIGLRPKHRKNKGKNGHSTAALNGAH